MKRWGIAGASLAVAALLMLVGAIGTDSPDEDDKSRSTTSSNDGSGNGGNAYRKPDAPLATIRLPPMSAEGPQPLRLTRAMLERAWQDGGLEVSPATGRRYRVVLENERLAPGGQWTVTGRVQTRLGAQAMVLTVGPDAVFGVLPQPDGSLLQITTTRGSTQISIAGSMLPPGSKSTLATDPDYLIPDTSGSQFASKVLATRLPDAVPPKASSLVEISVLGLYTDDLVELRGSVPAAETEVTNLFAIANQSYIDSGTRVRLQLAGLEQVGIDPSSSNHDALYAITDNRVSGVDLSRLRDDMAADLVALVRPHHDSHGSCGVAWLNGGGRMPQFISDHFGVSVGNVAPCGPHVLAHEIGHNLGSAHDRETQSINGHLDFGAYQYSFGHRQDGPPAFATVMAYTTGQPWLGYFSSPGSTLCGAKCGVADRADNVRSLNALAPVVAAFRGPPGTLSIVDAETYEPEAGSTSQLLFRVRLSGAAPVGGVSFDAVVTGGSAQAGVDYLLPRSARGTIPEDEREALVVIEVIGDAVREPDETIHVRLTNVIGATVHDGEAVGTILNDDPRPKLSGRIRFDSSVPRPDSGFAMTVTGASGGPDTASVELLPPHFAYEVPVVKGASLTIAIEAPPPFAILPFTLDEIESSRVYDIRLRKGVRVAGEVRMPAGHSALTEPMALDIRASIDGRYQPLPHAQLEPPDYRYSHWVVPGAWLYLEVVPPAPYQRFFAVNSDVRTDHVQNIALSTLPALVIWGGSRINEGYPGLRGSLGFVVELSAPAPAGGVRLRYRTVDGTATAGSDYTPLAGTMEIPEGESFAHTDQMEWFGDDEVEGDEYFHVVVSDVTGAQPVVTRVKVTLYESERQASTPSRPRRR